MKATISFRIQQKRLVSRQLFLAITIVVLASGSCTQTEVIGSEPQASCFTKESLETVPWIKDQLAFFQMPKSGPLQVALYSYRGKTYLVFINPGVSSPMSYIFSCEGKTIGELGIHYNEFYDKATKIAILHEAKY